MVLTIMAACSGNNPTQHPIPEIRDFTSEATAWADSVAATLSDRDMAAQVLMPAVYSDSATIASLRFYTDSIRPGGIILLKGDASSARSIAQTLTAKSPHGILVGIDAEWGLAMRIADAPEFPHNGRISPYATEQDMYDYGYELAREARLIGINTIFAPVLDVTPQSGQGIMGTRSFGPDPERVASLGVSFARGLEDGNIISVAKHFPGHGSASTDSHRSRPVILRTKSQLDSIDLLPYRKYIEAGLSGIMIGHLFFPAIDSVRRSAVVSPPIITGLLRNEMKFSGLVFTDALNMRGLGDVAHPVRDAILAGADIILAPADTRKAIDEILTALADGSLPRNTLRERCRRILFTKYRLGLHEPTATTTTQMPDNLTTPLTRRIISRLKN